MSEWAMKRFWTEVTVEVEADGFSIRLDGRMVRTPAKSQLIAPNKAVAERVAREWEAQNDQVDTTTMPWTRTVNAAIDKVAVQRTEVEAHLASYADTDLLCYRAEGPETLQLRQSEAWDPILDWLSKEFGVSLAVTQGVMPVSQTPAHLATLAATMGPMSHLQLTGFHDLVTLTGSFSLGLATAHNLKSAPELWAASRVDETWQIEQWGEDEEAKESEEHKKNAFLHAREVYLAGV